MTASSHPSDTDKQALDALLGLAQLRVAAEDYEVLLRTFGWLQEQTALLRPAAARYAEPATQYSPLDRP